MPLPQDTREPQQRVREQEALVRRLILSGAPNQAAEDRLRQLETALPLLRRRRSVSE